MVSAAELGEGLIVAVDEIAVAGQGLFLRAVDDQVAVVAAKQFIKPSVKVDETPALATA